VRVREKRKGGVGGRIIKVLGGGEGFKRGKRCKE